MQTVRQVLILAVLAVILWAFCGGLIAGGRSFMSMEATLILHAIGAPLGAALAAWAYHSKVGHFSPLTTAMTFLLVALFLDVFVVALLIERSFEMFASPLGTWIPLALIFSAALVVGRSISKG